MTGLAAPREWVDSESHAGLRPVLSDSARRRGLRGAVDADHRPQPASRLRALRRDPRRRPWAAPQHPLPTPALSRARRCRLVHASRSGDVVRADHDGARAVRPVSCPRGVGGPVARGPACGPGPLPGALDDGADDCPRLAPSASADGALRRHEQDYAEPILAGAAGGGQRGMRARPRLSPRRPCGHRHRVAGALLRRRGQPRRGGARWRGHGDGATVARTGDVPLGPAEPVRRYQPGELVALRTSSTLVVIGTTVDDVAGCGTIGSCPRPAGPRASWTYSGSLTTPSRSNSRTTTRVRS